MAPFKECTGQFLRCVFGLWERTRQFETESSRRESCCSSLLETDQQPDRSTERGPKQAIVCQRTAYTANNWRPTGDRRSDSKGSSDTFGNESPPQNYNADSSRPAARAHGPPFTAYSSSRASAASAPSAAPGAVPSPVPSPAPSPPPSPTTSTAPRATH
jgi:hypothetical protein